MDLPLCLVAAIQTCIQLLRLGMASPHREARLRRRELRQRQQAEEKDLAERMRRLQAANEHKQRELEDMRLVCALNSQLQSKVLSCRNIQLSRNNLNNKSLQIL